MTKNIQDKKNSSKKRLYLSAEERKVSILNAAFEEFSTRGFLATSLERIASRANISKSGIYTHYKSKNEVFESMLMSILLPPENQMLLIKENKQGSLSTLVDNYINKRYTLLNKPKSLAAFRLLMVESTRIPELVQSFIQKLIDYNLNNDLKLLLSHQQNKETQAAELENFLLASSPMVFWLCQTALWGQDPSLVSLEKVQALHKHLLLEILQNGIQFNE